MITFKELVSGNRFFLNDLHLMKIAFELCNIDGMSDGVMVRTQVKNQKSGYEATGRAVIVFNAVDLNTGGLLSILDDQQIELSDDSNYSQDTDSLSKAKAGYSL
jgi:hypothetical protein|tara:strand:- start:22 stop:333 length:312 start_codon:yes stop_codon:yes gene_type:complete